MSKKNRSGATMTLKDFHGGSIPSDLQLPSAPGMTVDRGAYERQGSNAWANNSMNRGGYGGDRGSYHHRQGGPVNGLRPFEDKASYFPNTANIGRNYDEDERRPVDHRPRSSPGNDGYRSPSDIPGGGRHDKSASFLDSRASDFRYPRDNGSSSSSFKGQQSGSPDRLQLGSSFQNVGRFGVPQQQSSSVPAPRTPPERPSNAWAARRGLDSEVQVVSPWRVRNNMARIAEASALDKITSGRWQPGCLASGPERDSDKLISRKEVVIQAAPYEDSRKVETLQITHGLEQEFDSRMADNFQFENLNAWNSQTVPAEIVSEKDPRLSYRVDYGAVRAYHDTGNRGATSAVHAGDASFASRSYDHTERSDSFRRGVDRYVDSYQDDKFRNLGRDDQLREEDRFRNVGMEEHIRGGYDRLEIHDDGGRYIVDPQGVHRHAGFRAVPGNRQFYGSNFYEQADPSYLDRPQRKTSSEYERNRTLEFTQQSFSHAPPSVTSGGESERSGTALHRSNSGERPKLKLLPRSKPVDDSAEQEFPEVEVAEDVRARHQYEAYEVNAGPYVNADVEHDVHRSKLALKARCQIFEGAAGSEKERQNLFGGARPREMVLKDRSADDIAIAGVEATCDPSRVEAVEVVRSDKDRWSGVRQEGRQFDTRNGERQESGRLVNANRELMRSESDRYDSRRDSGRQDRRDHHHLQQQQQQQLQPDVRRDIDRQDNWRRPPVDPPVLPLAEIPSRASGNKAYGGGSGGGSSSALQLAQAFSRSASLSRSSTGSRLTDTPSPRYNNNSNSGMINMKNSNSNFINSSSRQRPMNKAAW